jgi:hypothetical protein
MRNFALFSGRPVPRAKTKREDCVGRRIAKQAREHIEHLSYGFAVVGGGASWLTESRSLAVFIMSNRS